MKMNSSTWIVILVLIIVLLGVLMAKKYFSPIVDVSKETFEKIDSLNNIIKQMENHQKKLDTTINIFNDQINNVDNNINKIQNQKTIIKEIYHEKINNVTVYDRNQIDSFFTERYGHGSN